LRLHAAQKSSRFSENFFALPQAAMVYNKLTPGEKSSIIYELTCLDIISIPIIPQEVL